MFYVIGLGLCDEKDITVRGLEVNFHTLSHRYNLNPRQAVKKCSRIYLEAYTSILLVDKEKLVSDIPLALSSSSFIHQELPQESFYGKPIITAYRETVETESDEILRNAKDEDVALLVVGDPFG